jgi:hypothetical protein
MKFMKELISHHIAGALLSLIALQAFAKFVCRCRGEHIGTRG